MFKQIKRKLGIEGVKIDIEIYEIHKENFTINGVAKFQTVLPNTISSFNIQLLEYYSIGRGSSVKHKDYVLGEFFHNNPIVLDERSSVEINFSIQYKMLISEMDELEKNYFLLSPFVKMAKKLKNIQSQFFIKAEAIVLDSPIKPIYKREIEPLQI